MSLDEQIAAHVSEMKADGSWRQMETYAALRARSGQNDLAKDMGLEGIEGVPVGLYEFLKDVHTDGPPCVALYIGADGRLRVGVDYPYMTYSFRSEEGIIAPDASANMRPLLEVLWDRATESSTSTQEGDDDFYETEGHDR